MMVRVVLCVFFVDGFGIAVFLDYFYGAFDGVARS